MDAFCAVRCRTRPYSRPGDLPPIAAGAPGVEVAERTASTGVN